jgi:AraC-like DNA-binding protein
LALVQLPGRMRLAVKRFRKITGLTAVTSLVTSLPEDGRPLGLSPPVHPLCARRLRAVDRVPCSEQWRLHVRSLRRSPRTHGHTCPIGLRCTCVPICVGDHLVGAAKLVADSDTSEADLKAAVTVLELVVSETCQDSVVSALSEELRALQQRVTDLQQMQSTGRPGGGGSHPPTAPPTGDTDGQGAAMMHRVLACLQGRYQEPTLSLPAVAVALDYNPRYLTTRFTQVVGEHMHTYLVGLRVAHACRALMRGDASIKEVAFESGFSGPRRLDSAFRRYVGLSPSEYRRIFASP